MQHTCSTAGAVLIVCWDFGLLLYCICTSSVLQFRKGWVKLNVLWGLTIDIESRLLHVHKVNFLNWQIKFSSHKSDSHVAIRCWYRICNLSFAWTWAGSWRIRCRGHFQFVASRIWNIEDLKYIWQETISTDPEAYYYTTGTLNSSHETDASRTERNALGTERNVLGMKRNTSRTERFAFLRTERFVRFGLVFNSPRYSDFLAWRIGLLFISATQNENKFHLFVCNFLWFEKGLVTVKIVNIISLFKQLCLHSENYDQYLDKYCAKNRHFNWVCMHVLKQFSYINKLR